jgi:hypothetical protein
MTWMQLLPWLLATTALVIGYVFQAMSNALLARRLLDTQRDLNMLREDSAGATRMLLGRLEVHQDRLVMLERLSRERLGWPKEDEPDFDKLREEAWQEANADPQPNRPTSFERVLNDDPDDPV